ncbi:Golgi apparatus membrane protein TVP15 [Trypanosoma melophagium]|uniref:Golgi apparatus membrane protein TVP15 n=1 Tax=Trypanosoma melophagium TaxID=715481 RepID=UPI00351A0118|nr:Golgi apparatus membrane protein TVP15 [Trypanosoma melophagium]
MASRGSQYLSQDSVYYQQQQQQGPSAAGKNWVRLFLLLSCASTGLIMAASFLNIITLSFGVSAFFLEVYLVILSFFAFTAELRQVNCLRGLIYKWLKYLYFLSTYTGRGFFYIFLGTLAFGGSILRYIASGTAISLGIIMILVNIFVTLPVFVDSQVVREEEAARRAAATAAAANLFNEVVMNPQSSNSKSPATAAPTVATATGDGSKYVPPGLNEGPNAL